MIEKLKALFDNRITWVTIGTITGTIFGDQAAIIANAFGALVMAAI